MTDQHDNADGDGGKGRIAMEEQNNAPAPGKHTPGPWEVIRANARGKNDPEGKSLWVYPVAGHGMGWVGDSYMSVHLPSENGGEANARLIAAAPDLLAYAKAQDQWEARVILEGDWSDECVRLTPDLHESWNDLAVMRLAAIARTTGAAS